MSKYDAFDDDNMQMFNITMMTMLITKLIWSFENKRTTNGCSSHLLYAFMQKWCILLSVQLVHFLCTSNIFFIFCFSLLHLLNLISLCHFCYEDCEGFEEGQYLQALPRTIKNVDFKEYSPQEHHYNVSWEPVNKHIMEGMYK